MVFFVFSLFINLMSAQVQPSHALEATVFVPCVEPMPGVQCSQYSSSKRVRLTEDTLPPKIQDEKKSEGKK